MRQTKLFTKTRKEAPSDEVAKNAQFLIRAGYIHKEMAGVYTLLPLGLRVMEKITRIIKEEMDMIGGVQMKTSALQSKEVWEQTGRWDDAVVDNWFKTTLKNGSEVGLSFTNEEAYSSLVKGFISSYKDLPIYPYDFKSIFRNEERAKNGILRGREFYWKALYSFSKDKAEHDDFYEKAKIAYMNVYDRVGLRDHTYMTFASGSTFAKYSHEFQTICAAGEDVIYVHKEKGVAVNKEVYTDEVLADLGLSRDELVEHTSVEVGNIFSLGFKFSEPFDLTYKNAEGINVPVFMGSYGIGVTRLMGTIIEILSDDKGIVWPESVAPFKIHLLSLGETVQDKAQEVYDELTKYGVEVLWDDRVGVSPGEKFADSDLIGIPHRIVISERSIAAGGLEYKLRTAKESEIVSIASLVERFA